MQHYDSLIVDAQGAVATVTFSPSREDGEAGMATLGDLENLVAWLEDESMSSLVMFRGTTGAFFPGFRFSTLGPGPTADIYMHNRWEKMLLSLERLPKRTLAVIDGACTGAGMQLALACDHRIATTHTVMQLPEVQQGYLPGMAVFRLAKYVGLGIAKRLVLTGMPWTAADALAWGLVDWLCTSDTLAPTVEQLIEQLLPTNVDVVRLARRLLHESYAERIEEALGCLLAAQHRCIARLVPTAAGG